METGMSGLTASGHEGRRQVTNAGLFFKRWLANPLQMGSIIPSSPSLCNRIASLVARAPDEVVLELGAGTGVISRALLAAGVPQIVALTGPGWRWLELATGHWPMFSAPDDLASLLHGLAPDE
jgi:hypothetical protein